MSKYVKTREQRNGWMRLQKNELKTGVDTNMAKKIVFNDNPFTVTACFM